MSILKNKKIVLGVTGSIAAYKSPLLVRELVKAGAAVNVVMTASSTQFVTPLVMENLSKNPVAIEMFQESIQSGGAWHIQLAHWCDLMAVIPCSATTLAKMANGICDSALVTVATALPQEVPLVIAPAMDSTMWLNPATQRNVNTLKHDGAIIIPPAEGELASGLTGPGRLPEIDVLMKFIWDALQFNTSVKKDVHSSHKNIDIQSHGADKEIPIEEEKPDNDGIEIIVEKKKDKQKPYEEALKEALEKPIQSLEDALDKDKWNAEFEFSQMKDKEEGIEPETNKLSGKKILITAGPTVEKIDDVRYISNHSSGKMGYALALAAKEAGADVTLVSGPVNISSPDGIKTVNVESAKEMYDSVMKEFPEIDIAILSAAVSDYTPKEVYDGKLKKMDVGKNMNIELESTIDILATLGSAKKENQKVIGFALESANEIENGWKKLKAKNADMIVVNSANKPQSGFGGDENTITILTRDGKEQAYPPMSKLLCAGAILKKIAGIL